MPGLSFAATLFGNFLNDLGKDIHRIGPRPLLFPESMFGIQSEGSITNALAKENKKDKRHFFLVTTLGKTFQNQALLGLTRAHASIFSGPKVDSGN